MSGFEILGAILGMYPLIATAVAIYKDTKTTRGAHSSLIRGLKVESVIYREFVRKLLASDLPVETIEEMVRTNFTGKQSWNATLEDKLSRRLGPNVAPVVLQVLKELLKILDDINEVLKQGDRGSEVLGEFRRQSRFMKRLWHQPGVHEQLRQLKALNTDLRRLLDVSQLNTNFRPQNNLRFPTSFLVRDYQHAKDLYDSMGQSYSCNCNEPHVANFALHRPSKTLHCFDGTKSYKWRFDVLFPLTEPKKRQGLGSLQQSGTDKIVIADEELAAADGSGEENVDTDLGTVMRALKLPSWKYQTSVTLFAEDNKQQSDSRSIIQDLCSFVETLTACSKRPEVILGFIGNNNTVYKMLPNQEVMAASTSIVGLDELWAPGHRRLRRKERLQLAFRLSSAILQFCRTPWIDQSWTWKDFSALLKDEPQIALSQLFVNCKFYSARLLASTNSKPRSMLSSIDNQPILTKLGIGLIEIVFGRPLSEVRVEMGAKNDADLDLDLVNLQTAQVLLKSRQIADEESQAYEEIVEACIYHRYRDKRDLELKGLDSTDPSFFENAEEAILRPLYRECIKSWDPEQL